MKTPLKKLLGAVQKHDRSGTKILPLAQLDELAKASALASVNAGNVEGDDFKSTEALSSRCNAIRQKIKLTSVKLAMNYMKRVSAELETAGGGPDEQELIVKGVRFALEFIR
ncbi:hypothetical protein V2J09_020403 [Rumex salicifolius]